MKTQLLIISLLVLLQPFAVAKVIPPDIAQWIENELAKSPLKEPLDIHKEPFFSYGQARIVGYIHGYTPQMGFKTGVVYSENVLTREGHPVVIEIEEDGRFECSYSIAHPKTEYAVIGSNLYFEFYIEPGRTLAIYLDLEDINLQNLDRSQHFTGTSYGGPLARINAETDHANRQASSVDRRRIAQEGENMEAEAYIAFVDSLTEAYRKDIKKASTDASLHPTTRKLLALNEQLEVPKHLLQYDMMLNGKKVSEGYYDFFHTLPLNDPCLLATELFDPFITQFEVSNVFIDAHKPRTFTWKAEKTFLQYLTEELGVKLTSPEDKRYIYFTNKQEITEEETTEYIQVSEAFCERYRKALTAYEEKYRPPFSVAGWFETESWKDKDSIYTHVLGMESTLVYEMTKVRSLRPLFTDTDISKEDARDYLNKMKKDISLPFLQSEAERIYITAFPVNKKAANELPAGDKGTEILKRIVEPHKGKYTLVGFWNTGCRPCILNMKEAKELRDSYKGHTDISFVFITSDRESGKERYDAVVKEQELEYTHRIPDDEYVYLRQLLRFNSVPRYMLIDREGKMIDDNLNYCNSLENVLQDLLKNEI